MKVLERFARFLELIVCICILSITIFFATYHLLEAPKTWYDEGMFIQVARNTLIHQGGYVVRTSPDTLIPAGYFTTISYPVIAPIALAFRLFGIGLLQARSVMVVYLVLCVVMLYLFVRKYRGWKMAAWSAALLATHPPLYGNGKNVLGEVPGLFWLFVLLLLVELWEVKGFRRWWFAIPVGLAAGLFAATKQSFILLAPVLVLVLGWLVIRRRLMLASAATVGVTMAVPLLIFFRVHYGPTESLLDIFRTYAAPPGLSTITGMTLPQLILHNLFRVVSDPTVAAAALTVAIWVWHIVTRFRKRELIHAAEWLAFGFVVVMGAYVLKMPPFNRYIFPIQAVAFAFLPAAVFAAWERVKSRLPARIQAWPVAILLLAALVAIQAYQTAFHSWIAGYYTSTRTAHVASYFKSLPKNTSVFLYDVMEVATFVPTENYYQFFRLVFFSKNAGEDQVPKIAQGIPDVVILSLDEDPTHVPGLLDRYVLQPATPMSSDYAVYVRK